MSNFDLYSRYYDLLYQSKDYEAEADYLHECLKKYCFGAKEILEYGSGTGKHGLLLAGKGFSVFGIERSADMIAEAQKAGFDCMQADISDYKLDKQFDVVLALFHVISYLTSNSVLISTFANARRSLKDGGYFIFDVWYSPAVYSQKAETRIKRVGDETIDVIRIAEPVLKPNENVVDVNYSVLVKEKNGKELVELKETHPMRHFSIPEIELLAGMHGFELVRTEAFLTGKQPSPDSWGVIFILKKQR